MSQEQSKKPEYKWVPRKDGTFHDIYANIVNASWTLFDVRIRLGQLIPVADYGPGFVVEERGTLTLAWPEAKILRDALTGLVNAYEEANGEIKQLKLPADFSSKPKVKE